jgi:hypothetical protein
MVKRGGLPTDALRNKLLNSAEAQRSFYAWGTRSPALFVDDEKHQSGDHRIVRLGSGKRKAKWIGQLGYKFSEPFILENCLMFSRGLITFTQAYICPKRDLAIACIIAAGSYHFAKRRSKYKLEAS